MVRLDSSSRETSVGIEPVLRSFRDRYLPGVESMLVMVVCRSLKRAKIVDVVDSCDDRSSGVQIT